MANPQVNSILEKNHQVITNLVRTYDLQNNYLDEYDPWSRILAATAFALQSTYPTTLQDMPCQLIFGHDTIFNTPLVAGWEAIMLRKLKIMDRNNQLEDKNRKPHTYITQDKVLVHNKKVNKHEEPCEGPYLISQLWTNGNVTICWGAV